MNNALSPGNAVTGLDPAGGVATVRSVRPMGSAVFVEFENSSGKKLTRFLTADQAAAVKVEATFPEPQFAADRNAFLHAIDALHLKYAADLDPMLAVSSSNVEPLPHQVQAVYDELLPRQPLKFLLADDPGAGKTIMTGLYLKERMARGTLDSCIIVAPGSLVEQWQEELWLKFGLTFTLLERDHLIEDGEGRPTLSGTGDFVIGRVDTLARNPRLVEAVTGRGFHLAVVDEAHKMSARTWGSKLMLSKRYQLGMELSRHCEDLLLLTATPHNGKPEDFALFMRLIDVHENDLDALVTHGPVRRLVKEQLVRIDGTPLFPPRVAHTLTYELGPLERSLYEAVTDYVRYEMNKASDESVRRTVGFALMVIQRRLASSPEALLRTLQRRADGLRDQLARARHEERALADLLALSLRVEGAEDPEDLSFEETVALEDDSASAATASRTPDELEAEIAVVDRLMSLAEQVRYSGTDRKWEALSGLLTSEDMFEADGSRRKIIIFTEHRDTLDYLEDRLTGLLRPGETLETIHGGHRRWERHAAEREFKANPNCVVLLATDAAGEGINLQVAHLMVNYDLPWNPNRLEQRFGRIHRIGQTRTCYQWNLVAADTREGDVFVTLLGKLEVQREALGDRVFDVLGDVLSGQELSGLLRRAVRGEDLNSITAAVDERLGRELEEKVQVRSAATSEFSQEELRRLRATMLLAKARRAQPHIVRRFARAALEHQHAQMYERGPDHWSVPYVPENLAPPGSPVKRRYPSLVLSQTALEAGDIDSEFLAVGHPLLSALVAATLEESRTALRDGVVLEDPLIDRDYLVATVSVSEETGSRLRTVRIWPDGSLEDVSIHCYEVLSAHAPSPPTRPAGGIPASARERLEQLGSVEALAYVIGTSASSGVVAEAPQPDRVAGPDLLPAPMPFEGWDYVRERDTGLELVQTRPYDVPAHVRENLQDAVGLRLVSELEMRA